MVNVRDNLAEKSVMIHYSIFFSIARKALKAEINTPQYSKEPMKS